MKEKILISACLLGRACRYDGRSVRNEDAIRLSEKYELIEICPEVDGGLPVPRLPSEIVGERVVNTEGFDVTENYLRGALNALRLALENGVKIAVLKERSPSCAKGRIYDGSFSKTLKDGDGITARLLLENGIKIYGESEIKKLF